jgi:hypothetical protein
MLRIGKILGVAVMSIAGWVILWHVYLYLIQRYVPVWPTGASFLFRFSVLTFATGFCAIGLPWIWSALFGLGNGHEGGKQQP